MKYLVLIFTTFFMAILTLNSAFSEESDLKSPPLRCDIGPVIKTYGGTTPWYVYSCDDNRTLVIITAEGNPAMHFYFTFFPQKTGYRLYGEGTGRKDLTDAAYNDIHALCEKDVQELIEQTKNH